MLLLMKSVIWFMRPTTIKDRSLFINVRKMVVFYLVMWINTVAMVHMKIKLLPHVHYTDLTPDNYLVTCDLGTDQVITYDLDQEGKLSSSIPITASPGAGSRHIISITTIKSLISFVNSIALLKF